MTDDVPLVDGLENISVTTDTETDMFDDDIQYGSDVRTGDEYTVVEPSEHTSLTDGNHVVGQQNPSVAGGKDVQPVLTEICVKPTTPPIKKPKKPVKVDKPKVQTAIGNMPATSGPADDDAVKKRFESIITRHVENKKIEKFRVFFNCVNLLITVTDPEGKTWENDDALKLEFCNQIEAAITAHPQEFQRDLREAITRKQTVVKVDALTGEQIETLADETVKIYQIKLAGFDDNKFYEDACRKFCNKDYVKAYFDFMKSEKGMEDTDVNNRLCGIINCITVFTDLELWAERRTKELIEKHDGNKSRLTDDERKSWDEVVGNTHPWVEYTLKAPKKVYNQSSDYPGYKKHVIVSSDGLAHLNIKGEMENNVLDKEIKDSYNVAWYRNEARNLNSSLCIPYKRTEEGYENFYPDFIFFEKNNNGGINANIIDPHGIQYDDYLPRLRGYIEYLKDHGADFGKVLAIANVSSTEYRSLNLKDDAVVKAIEEYTGDTVKDLFIGKASKLYWKK